ncbi:MAG TPA: elongation factor P-like protein YeiP, partial [Chromatiales bacterium]|nr:elongation factor P-like protein YeiP [Chromatiales bacterium]
MPKASDLKRGSVVELDDELYVVKDYESKSPSSRGAQTYYKVRFVNLKTKQKRDESFKASDFIKDGEFVRRSVQYSYRDADTLVFMDSEDYTQYMLAEEDLEDQVGYLTEDLK